MSKYSIASLLTILIVLICINLTKSEDELKERGDGLNEIDITSSDQQLRRVKRQKVVRVPNNRQRQRQRQRQRKRKRQKKKRGKKKKVRPRPVVPSQIPTTTMVPDIDQPMAEPEPVTEPETPISEEKSWPESEPEPEGSEPESWPEQEPEEESSEEEPEISDEESSDDEEEECDHKAMAQELFQKAQQQGMSNAMSPPNPMAMMAAGNEAKEMWDKSKQACFDTFKNKFGAGGMPMPGMEGMQSMAAGGMAAFGGK